MNPKFFDTVQGHGALYTFADNYFSAPFISKNLGYRNFRLIKNTDHSGRELKMEDFPHSQHPLLATALKIASWFLILPPIGLFGLKVLGRLILRAKIQYPDSDLSHLKEYVQENAAEFRSESVPFMPLSKRIDEANSAMGVGHLEYEIRTMLSYLLKQDADTQKLNVQWNDRPLKGHFHIPEIHSPSMNNDLPGYVQVAFDDNYSVWTGTVGWNDHARCLVINDQGEVQLIDTTQGTLLDSKRELDDIVKRLNHAQINKDGKPITFKGTLVSTRLQKDPYHCLMLSYLYAFAIAQSGDINGWRQFHAALEEGALKTCEDLVRVEDFNKIRRLKKHSKELYWNFLESCYRRANHIPADSWRELKLKDCILFPTEPIVGYNRYRGWPHSYHWCLMAPPDNFGKRVRGKVVFFEAPNGKKTSINDIDDSEIQKIDIDENQTLGEMIDTYKGKRIFLIEKLTFPDEKNFILTRQLLLLPEGGNLVGE